MWNAYPRQRSVAILEQLVLGNEELPSCSIIENTGYGRASFQISYLYYGRLIVFRFISQNVWNLSDEYRMVIEIQRSNKGFLKTILIDTKNTNKQNIPISGKSVISLIDYRILSNWLQNVQFKSFIHLASSTLLNPVSLNIGWCLLDWIDA